jgi:predicted MFS family arabinose efflux permease
VQVALLYYVLHTLGFSPATLGLLLVGASAGAMVGAYLTDRFTKRMAFGHLLVGSMVVGCAFSLALAIPVHSTAIALPLYMAALSGNGFGIAISSVTVLTLRQAVTAPESQGRMNAVYRMMVTGLIPVGALLGGFVTGAIGAPPALVIGAIWWTLTPAIAVLSPLRTLRELPNRADA